MASAINANQALSAAGITAHSSGGTVATGGSLTFREINDPGLRAVIPSLALWGGMLLAGLLAALGVRLNRKWGRA